ncbi:MAG: VWA domain-containing protein [Planctomycetota bacterium]|nr:VWA domain-containing protein [Planctomycetota bacterium]
MSFANLGWPLTLLGLGALAGALFLLQRLRVRHREVPVVTTMFWREAVEAARARVLTQRFRHPWAYALILLIASLIWLALAGPERRPDADTRTVVLLDGSARMARGDLFARAKEATLDTAADLPRDAREVVLCGAYPRRVLAPGEDVLLLEKRLEGIEADACPSTLSAVLRRMAIDEYNRRAFRVVTDATMWRVPEGIPADVNVARVPLDARSIANRGIVAFGVSEPVSGRFDAVDVYVEWRGSSDALELPPAGLDPDADVAIYVDNERLPAGIETTRSPLPVDGRDFEHKTHMRWFRDVPADGKTLRAVLNKDDDFALDNEALLVLPTRRVTRVGIDAALVEVVGPVVDADPALVRDDQRPDVRVARESTFIKGMVPMRMPRLVFVDETESAPMLYVQAPGIDADGSDGLREVVAALRLDEIDAVELATAAGRTVEVVGDVGEVRALAFWETLLTDRYDLVHTRTFPALIARSLRWLAGVESLAPYTAAGEPMRERITELVDMAADHRAVNVPATPPVAGRYTAVPDFVEALLAAPELTTPVETAVADAPVKEAGGFGGSAATWLLLVAFLLLCFEWVLFRTERIP